MFLVICCDGNPHQKLLHVRIDPQTDFWPDRTCEFKISLMKQIGPSVYSMRRENTTPSFPSTDTVQLAFCEDNSKN